MRRRWVPILLGAEAMACVAFCLLGGGVEEGFAAAAAFPLAQLGAGLRALSLAGGIGNALAVALYAAISLLPVGYLALRLARGRARAEDGLLALLCAVLFAVLYWMINPADIAARFGAGGLLSAHKALLGITVYAIAAGYLVLRALRRVEGGTPRTLLDTLRALLAVVCAVLVFGIFGAGLSGLLDAWTQLGASNTGAGAALTPSYVFLIVQYLTDVLPYALGTAVIFSGFGLMDALGEDLYGEAVAARAARTGRLCRAAVAAILLSQIFVNCLQLTLGPLVRVSRYTFALPLLPVVFVFAAMLAARYFEAAKRLKDDNDMFI